MNDEERAERMARIAANVRKVLLRSFEGRQLSQEDHDWLDILADARAVLLVNDSWHRRGVQLSEQGVAAYAYACHVRDEALAALKIDDPYRPRAN